MILQLWMFSLKILWCSYWSITHLILDWAYTQPFWMQDHGVNPMDDTVQLRYFLHKSQVVGNSDDNITSAVREYSFSFVLATSSRRLSKCCWLCRVGHDQCSECPLSLPPRPLPGPRSDSSSCHTIVASGPTEHQDSSGCHSDSTKAENQPT